MPDPDSKVVKPAGRPKPPNAGKGRVKGVPNKTTVAVKEALTQCFEKMGGVDALVTWAKGEPTEFYKLYAKLLPVEVKGDVNVNLAVAEALDAARRRMGAGK